MQVSCTSTTGTGCWLRSWARPPRTRSPSSCTSRCTSSSSRPLTPSTTASARPRRNQGKVRSHRTVLQKLSRILNGFNSICMHRLIQGPVHPSFGLVKCTVGLVYPSNSASWTGTPRPRCTEYDRASTSFRRYCANSACRKSPHAQVSSRVISQAML